MCMKWKKRKRKEKRLIPSGKDKNETRRRRRRPKRDNDPLVGFCWLTDWLATLATATTRDPVHSSVTRLIDYLRKRKKARSENRQTERERAWYSTVNTRVFLKEKDSSCGRCRLVQPHPNKTGNYQDGNPSSPREKFPSAHFSLFWVYFFAGTRKKAVRQTEPSVGVDS
jgi:hypothetical protein